MDIELPLVVRFGSADVPLRNAASLGPGSVIDLGRSPDEPVEIINVRLAAIGKKPALNFPKVKQDGKAVPTGKAKVYYAGRLVDTPVYNRAELGGGAKFDGPALIREHGTTTVMYEGDS